MIVEANRKSPGDVFMESCVKITFDCLPLRSLPQVSSPTEGSPKFQELVGRIEAAIKRYGRHNAYYLYNARCVFHLTNSESLGMLDFRFEGTLLTNAEDMKTQVVELEVDMVGETCDWLTEPALRWFETTVHRAVKVEFDRYIAAGDLDRTRERMEQLEDETLSSGGFLGMGL